MRPSTCALAALTALFLHPTSASASPPSPPTGCVLDITVAGSDDDAQLLLARIEDYETLGTWRTRSAGGKARFDGLEPGSYNATAEVMGMVPGSMKAVRCRGSETIEVTLTVRPAEAWFHGVVSDAAGRPLDARVSIVEAGRGQGVFPGPAIIDTRDGAYRLGVPAGSYNLYASAEGYRFGDGLTQRVRPGDETEFDFALKLEGRVQGKVLGPDGAPVGGAVVQRYPTTTKQSRTDSDGSYAIATSPGYEHLVSAHKGDTFGFARVGMVEEGDDRFGVDIPMKPGRTVHGKVVHSETGEPVGPTTVVWTAFGIGMLKKVQVAADGTFVANGVPTEWPAAPGVVSSARPADHITFFVHDHERGAKAEFVGLAPGESTIVVPFREKD